MRNLHYKLKFFFNLMSDHNECKVVFQITIDALNLKHLKGYSYDRNTAP